jgi:tRNA dimethylallyltransferase
MEKAEINSSNTQALSINSHSYEPQVIFIVGPTASGKSSLAMDVAQTFGGEIICADSQTVRTGLDIGTAKPSMKDQKLVRHYMLDVIGPYERFSAAEFKRQAEKCIDVIHRKGKVPIIVGGTGLYIDALLYDFTFKEKPDPTLREALNKKSVAELQKVLVDRKLPLPENEKNPRHLIRVIESNGEVPTKKTIRPGASIIGLDPGREELSRRIESRVDDMLDSNLIYEVESVIKKYGKPPEDWDAIGYRAVADAYLLHTFQTDKSSIALQMSTAHRQYAKRQRAWFKRNRDIKWFEQKAEAMQYIKKHVFRD